MAIETTEIRATIKKCIPVHVCMRCGSWFSVCLWGKDKDDEPEEVPLVKPRYCPICAGAYDEE